MEECAAMSVASTGGYVCIPLSVYNVSRHCQASPGTDLSLFACPLFFLIVIDIFFHCRRYCQ